MTTTPFSIVPCVTVNSLPPTMAIVFAGESTVSLGPTCAAQVPANGKQENKSPANMNPCLIGRLHLHHLRLRSRPDASRRGNASFPIPIMSCQRKDRRRYIPSQRVHTSKADLCSRPRYPRLCPYRSSPRGHQRQ